MNKYRKLYKNKKSEYTNLRKKRDVRFMRVEDDHQKINSKIEWVQERDFRKRESHEGCC